MLDPLTAFSLAGTIVQFIDFSCKTISTVKELSQSERGISEEVYNHEVVTTDLLKLSERLQESVAKSFADGASYSSSDQALKKLCEGCDSLSKAMLKRLGRLKIPDGAGKRTVLKKALKTMWSQKELAEMGGQLAGYQRQFEIHVLVAFKEKFDLTALKQHPGYSDQVSQKIIDGLLQNRSVFESAINSQTLEITTLHTETRSVIVDEHEKTRNVLLTAVERLSLKNSRPLHSRNVDYESPKLVQEAQDRILRSLYFASITERYEQVSEAHASTFEWIFEDPNATDKPWSKFNDWLQSGEEIYWINGKAGSGKSTLMKYLYGHLRTQELLKSWSGPLALNIVEFFFWSSGTCEQKSLVGLLRGLLYKLLSKHKDLIPTVLPDQWTIEYGNLKDDSGDRRWNFGRLETAFRAFRSLSGLKICLFVDGLDEYESPDKSHAEIASFFVDLAKSPGIKICVSSRPWLVFEDAFRSAPSLRLQDLTSKDITVYVHGKIGDHERMNQLRSIDPENAESLIQEIVARASGVFLWVMLVVKSLLDGFTNRDRISDLLERLRALPTNIEGFYKHMLLNHIPPIYRAEASHIFQIMLLCKKTGDAFPPLNLPVLVLRISEERGGLLDLKSKIRSWSNSKIEFEESEMAARLKSRCAGLLEVSEFSDDTSLSEDNSLLDEGLLPEKLTVLFLHRTVQDFLCAPDSQHLLHSWAPQDFNASTCLLKAYILSLETATGFVDEDNFHAVFERVTDALIVAQRSRSSKYGLNFQLVDALDEAATNLWLEIPISDTSVRTSKDRHWAWWNRHVQNADFLELAIAHGLVEYVTASFNKDCQQIQRKLGRPHWHSIFDYAHGSPLGMEMIAVLLRGGVKPNQCFEERSFWQMVLEKLAREEENDRLAIIDIGSRSQPSECTNDNEMWTSTFKMMIEAGAEQNQLCSFRHQIGRSGVYNI